MSRNYRFFFPRSILNFHVKVNSQQSGDSPCKKNSDGIVFVDEGYTTDTDRSSAFPTAAAHPNPFNPATTISYTLPEVAAVRLDIFSVAGQKVATLFDDNMSAGTNNAVFDGTGLASGVYVYRLTAGEAVVNGKMAMVRSPSLAAYYPLIFNTVVYKGRMPKGQGGSDIRGILTPSRGGFSRVCSTAPCAPC